MRDDEPLEDSESACVAQSVQCLDSKERLLTCRPVSLLCCGKSRTQQAGALWSGDIRHNWSNLLTTSASYGQPDLVVSTNAGVEMVDVCEDSTEAPDSSTDQ